MGSRGVVRSERECGGKALHIVRRRKMSGGRAMRRQAAVRRRGGERRGFGTSASGGETAVRRR